MYRPDSNKPARPHTTQHGQEPESLTEVTASGENLKVCAYPDKPVVTSYSGGNPVITCVHRNTVPPAQAAASLTVWDSYLDRH